MGEKFDVIVIGAGASGLLAAGRAAQSSSRVLLLERMRQEGRKLMITGKGRCNITNHDSARDFVSHVHPDGRFLMSAFTKFFSKDIIKLLEENGLGTKLERGGRYFPETDNAQDVVRILVSWVNKQGVDVRCGQRVEKLLIKNNEVTGLIVNGEELSAKKIILATGGKSYPATGSSGDGFRMAEKAGHTVIKPRPSLVPLETREKIPQKLHKLNLKNVRALVWSNDKKIGEDFGEVMFMEFGLSGPIVLTLSRMIVNELDQNKKIKITLDLKPALDEQKLDNRLIRELDDYGNGKIMDVMRKLMPSVMIPFFADYAGIELGKPCNQLSSKERKRIGHALKNLSFDITGYRSFKEAIITAGGISAKEINPKTMESKLIKGLYFAGEIIDLDADTGGYNLQIAWSTGWVAGEAAASMVNG